MVMVDGDNIAARSWYRTYASVFKLTGPHIIVSFIKWCQWSAPTNNARVWFQERYLQGKLQPVQGKSNFHGLGSRQALSLTVQRTCNCL